MPLYPVNMPRPVSLALSQWFRRDFAGRSWVALALCRRHRELPWTADLRPSFTEINEMRMVCVQCPVIASCAAFGLTQPGGFYAGTWLPWAQPGNEADEAKPLRTAGRRELRRISREPERIDAAQL